MPDKDLVVVRENGWEHLAGRARAAAQNLEVLDEPVRDASGNPRRRTRVNGRPVKPKTTVDTEAAKRPKTPAGDSAAGKKAAATPAPAEHTETDPPSEGNES